jgi:hypothetical protein
MFTGMEKDQVFQLRHDKAWMCAIDSWRRAQAIEEDQDISKAEAIRRLVAKALEQATHERTKP